MKNQEAPTFGKQQILRSLRIAPVRKDVLRTLLRDDERYTLDQAHSLIEQFANRKVN
jgi:hypothetical protein